MPNAYGRFAALGVMVVAAVLSAGCGTRPPVAALPEPVAPYRSTVYADPATWLCRPDRDDPCAGNLDATVIAADGTTSIEHWAPAADPAFDCFYIYPTVSLDPGTNSDLVAGTEEINAVRAQAARFGSTCRVFAPVYRQVTVTALTRALGTAASLDAAGLAEAVARTAPGTNPGQIVYDDVRDAFRHYVAQDSGGRNILLLGHSQGATAVARLVREEMAPGSALGSRLVAAYTIGLPPGERPDPAVIPPCTSGTDTGCFVAYSSFRSTAPPSVDGLFARSLDPGACTSPAAPGGGTAPLHPYFPAHTQQWLDPARGPVTTPFVSPPGLLAASCVRRDPYAWLEVTLTGDPTGGRATNLPSTLPPAWGLHTDDVQLALGDLIALAGQQGAALGRR